MANIAMTECHRDVLRKVRVYMMENLDIDTIIEHLVEKLLLTANDEDTIKAEQTARKKIKALLDILPRKGDVGFNKLMEVLRDQQTFVYEHLRTTEIEYIQAQRSRPMGVSPVTPAAAAHQPSGIYSQATDSSSLPHQMSGAISHPTDETRISMDVTDSGPRRAHSTQITTEEDTGQDIQPGVTIPRSPMKIVTNQALSALAGKLGSEWEQLAIHMGFPSNKLFVWKQESPTVWGRVFAMLDCWKRQNASGATVGRLLQVLLSFSHSVSPSAYRHLYFE